MARSQGKILDSGEFFPDLEFNTTEGDKIVLPLEFGNRWNVFLMHHGHT